MANRSCSCKRLESRADARQAILSPMWAQSIVEYGGAGGGIFDRIAAVFSSAYVWVETSLRHDRPVWIVAGVCLLMAMWLFRKR